MNLIHCNITIQYCYTKTSEKVYVKNTIYYINYDNFNLTIKNKYVIFENPFNFFHLISWFF